MIKSELINKLTAKLTHIPEKDIATSINIILDGMSNTLSSGQRIEIRGFGSFNLHYRPPRQAHNPKTGAKVLTLAKYSPHFKPGKAMRDRVDSSRGTIPISSEPDLDESEE